MSGNLGLLDYRVASTLVVITIISALLGPRPLFNIKSSPSETGLLTEIVPRWPGVERSNHPSHSVAAIGGRNAFGFGSPWDKLQEWNAWVLVIGANFHNCTLLHHVQTRYKHQHEGETWKTPRVWSSSTTIPSNRQTRRNGARDAAGPFGGHIE